MSSEETKKKAEAAEDEAERSPSELHEKVWAVISFGGPVATELTFDEAVAKIAEVEGKDLPGLCIVSNDAAERMKK
ncbi:MAG: hypothetical protein DWQ47_13380 [Acidobacteria bacterium]|nr:MAG: hypothetical protein DWQ32_00780 [Acidobacteriota bacterium]REK02930.1 MAG: hypothetical protein DWQ38_11355 [Acidobacteriota bacterium]REK13266.1 MAG: hypothetical protein DWQ43_06470 [Acidobacteriota bacterium]REK41260.1 MAG: hypothetical protein DWQ47_13380 [Acidobacteriota bacterium]